MSRREELKDLMKELVEEILIEILEDEDDGVEFEGSIGVVENCTVKDGVLGGKIKITNDRFWEVFKQAYDKN